MLQSIPHGPVVELRLARPPANALDTDLIAALREAVAAAPAIGARALVLSGAPGMFSGGLDVPSLLTLDRDGIRRAWADFYALMRGLAASPIPVAAAITGHSPAGGAVLALFCDFRVMADGDYRIGLNEVQVGLPMPPMIHRALRRQVGARAAERMCTTAWMMSPRDAQRIGFVDELRPLDEVVPAAVDWCAGVLRLPPRAMAKTRALARADLLAAFDAGGESELDELAADWVSEETQGALRALVERLKKRS
ncbi:MAG: enoyl-CoA hydratase/isomerase family protein [Acidobacteriota bacterium]